MHSQSHHDGKKIIKNTRDLIRSGDAVGGLRGYSSRVQVAYGYFATHDQGIGNHRNGDVYQGESRRIIQRFLGKQAKALTAS
jgi:hypothetical protein